MQPAASSFESSWASLLILSSFLASSPAGASLSPLPAGSPLLRLSKSCGTLDRAAVPVCRLQECELEVGVSSSLLLLLKSSVSCRYLSGRHFVFLGRRT